MARRLLETTRKRLEKEVGTVYKPHAANIRFALAFPNTYYVGMSNLGFQTVYRLLNESEGAVCERVFLPDPQDLADLSRAGDSLFSMETQTPVRDFDVLAFSISYEPDCANILKVLSLSRMDELAEDRGPDQPLVIAGGPVATFNPEPLTRFIDAFVVGEAEEVLQDIVNVLHASADKDQALERLALIPGVYVPGFYAPVYNDDGTIQRIEVSHGAPERIRRHWARDLDLYDPVSAILTPETEFSNMALAEVARGCGRKCRFCTAGYAYLPPRARSAERILSGIERMDAKARERSAVSPRIGLLSASVFDHPSSLLVCQSLLERNRLFSISSTRADVLNNDVAEALHRGGHETLTIAPEAGTDRLRMAINKAMSDQDVLDAARIAWDGGFRRLKLYFMVGLPTETDEDVEGIRLLVSKVVSMFSWQRIVVSISCFVPKPWTPFQWVSMAPEKELSRKLSVLRGSLRPTRSVTVSSESAREAIVQGVLARGDRRLGEALLLAHREGVGWRAALSKAGLSAEFYAQRLRHRDEVFPWDHLDLGIHKTYLWHEYEQAMKAAATIPCVVGTCRRCGVCR